METNNDNIVTEISVNKFHNLYPEFAGIDSNKNALIMTRKAANNIKKHISWSKKTKENIREQGGLLIGKPYLVNNKYISTVEFSIIAEVEYSNSAYLKMGHQTWNKMLDFYDNNYREENYYIVGWYHTHPNTLSVFMSSTDCQTQRLFFQKEWHFALILNPHKKLVACFNSIDAVSSVCLNFTDCKNKGDCHEPVQS